MTAGVCCAYRSSARHPYPQIRPFLQVQVHPVAPVPALAGQSVVCPSEKKGGNSNIGSKRRLTPIINRGKRHHLSYHKPCKPSDSSLRPVRTFGPIPGWEKQRGPRKSLIFGVSHEATGGYAVRRLLSYVYLQGFE